MIGHRFTVCANYGGTLAANQRGEFKLSVDASLIHVSSCQSNAGSATLDVGTSAARTGILSAKTVGVSATPNIVEAANFNGSLATAGDAYHMVKGTIVTWDLDYDGAAATAGQNVCIVLTFTEG